MKYVTGRLFADPDAAARKLVEIANAAEAVHADRICTFWSLEPALKARTRDKRLTLVSGHSLFLSSDHCRLREAAEKQRFG